MTIAYSLFFVALSYLEGTRKRVNYCARGVAIPLFLLILGFWIKFIGDDHILSKDEKTELFQYTTTCFLISALLFTYSFRTEKKVKPEKVVADPENDADGDKELTAEESEASTSSEEDVLPPPDGDPADAGVADAENEASASSEEEVLPPPDDDTASADALAPESVEKELLPPPEEDALPPPDGAPADASADAPEANESEGGVPEDSSSENEFLENLGLDKTQSIPPAADSGAASYQFPPEADDPPDESQEETDTSLKIIDEDADDPKPPPS